MTHKAFFSATAFIFALVFVLHLLRVIYGWGVTIGGWSVPMWFSWAGVLVAGYLSWTALKAKK